MEFFGGIQFFLLLILIFVPAVILGVLEKPLQKYRTAASALVIVLVLWPNRGQLVSFAAFFLLEFVLIRCYLSLRLRQGEERSTALYRLFLAGSLLPLVLSKLSEAGLGFEIGLFQFLGISYLTFRSLQMIIEMYDGIIKEVRWLDFADFLLLFSTFSCGPIDRSRRYLKDAANPPDRQEYLELVGDGLLKLLAGVIYKFILAILAHKGVVFFQDPQSLLEYIGYSYCSCQWGRS